METFAFYLALATIFIPKKYKKITGYVSFSIFAVTLLWLISSKILTAIYHVHTYGIGVIFLNNMPRILFSFWQANPFAWLVFLAEKINIDTNIVIIITAIIEIIFALFALRANVYLEEENGKKKIKFTFEKFPKKEKKEKIKMENNVSNAETQATASAQSVGAAENKPISMWGYFGYEILFAMPVIGWIILIVNAIAAKNVNVKNFARSYFCLLIVAAIIFALGAGSFISNLSSFGF